MSGERRLEMMVRLNPATHRNARAFTFIAAPPLPIQTIQGRRFHCARWDRLTGRNSLSGLIATDSCYHTLHRH